MSMDLNIWKYNEGATHDDNRVYELACCDGEKMEELESLPVDEILKKVASVFSAWTALEKNMRKMSHCKKTLLRICFE